MGGPGDVASAAVLQYFANPIYDIATGRVMPSSWYELIDIQILYGYSMRRLIFRHGNLFCVTIIYDTIIYDNYIAHTYRFTASISTLRGYVRSSMNLSTPAELYDSLIGQPGASAAIGEVVWCGAGFYTPDKPEGRPGIILGHDSHTGIYIISPTSTNPQNLTDTHLFLAGSPDTQGHADLHLLDGSNNRTYMPKDCYFNYRETWAVPHFCVRPMDKGTIRVDKNSPIFNNQNKFSEA